MSGIVQVSHRFPIQPGLEEYAEHVREGVRDKFGRELMQKLAGSGGIVGPIHENATEQDDWLWNTGTKDVSFTIYAYVTDLPEPEQYRLMGGPADGYVVMTGGVRVWRVPFLPRITVVAPFDVNERVDIKYAEYEREGDTQVYLYRRIAS